MIMHIDSYKFTCRNTVSTYVATISLFESNLCIFIVYIIHEAHAHVYQLVRLLIIRVL